MSIHIQPICNYVASYSIMNAQYSDTDKLNGQLAAGIEN